MSRLLIVSNRIPVSVTKKNGELHFDPSAGGVATGLGSFYRSHRSLWIGWPGITREKVREREKEEIREQLHGQDCQAGFHLQEGCGELLLRVLQQDRLASFSSFPSVHIL